MDRYIGLDGHSQSCTLRVVTPTGKEVGREVVETNGAALVQAVRSIPGSKHLCIEEGTQSAWLYELLQNEVEELVVTMPARRSGSKDDARDALQLAEGLRTGAIKQRVYKSCGPYSELRAAVRSYTILRDDLTRAKNRLKAIYRSRAILPPVDEVYHARTHEQWERKLAPPQRESAALLYAQVDSLAKLWATAEERLLEASKPHKIVKILSTAPAIGPIRAAQIVAIVVTPHRFRTSRQFWAYCGLAIVMRSSSDWVRGPQGDWLRSKVRQPRGLNRNRQPVLKSVFKGAALQVGDADDEPPSPRGLPEAARRGHEAEPRAADHRSQNRGGGPGDVEARGGLRSSKATVAHHRAGVTPPNSGAPIACAGYEAYDGFAGEHPSNPWPPARDAQALETGYAPAKYQMKQWPNEALLEGWYSFTEVPRRFALVVPSCPQRTDPNLAPHDLEQKAPRNRLPRAAAAANANQPPDAKGEVGYMDEYALDVAFLGRI